MRKIRELGKLCLYDLASSYDGCALGSSLVNVFYILQVALPARA